MNNNVEPWPLPQRTDKKNLKERGEAPIMFSSHEEEFLSVHGSLQK